MIQARKTAADAEIPVSAAFFMQKAFTERIYLMDAEFVCSVTS